MIVQYELVRVFKDAPGLSRCVNSMIRQGWELYGTPFGDDFISQAMVKRKQPEQPLPTERLVEVEE